MSGKNGQNRPTHLWTYLDQEAKISATHMLPTHKHTCCWRKVLLQPPPLEPCYLCTPLAKRRIGWEIWSLKGSRTFSPQRLEPRTRCITKSPQVWKPETRQPPVVTQRLEALFWNTSSTPCVRILQTLALQSMLFTAAKRTNNPGANLKKIETTSVGRLCLTKPEYAKFSKKETETTATNSGPAILSLRSPKLTLHSKPRKDDNIVQSHFNQFEHHLSVSSSATPFW